MTKLQRNRHNLTKTKKVIDAVGDENDVILKRDAIEVAQKTIL
ncbi:hypothetical protein [Phocaeicola sartorii]|jgi:hypothetical protein|nr:hypothetical protein [Phocaeicola sartorii]